MSDLVRLMRRIVANTLSLFDRRPEQPVIRPETPRMRVVPRKLPPWRTEGQTPHD
jgi:hypothetical protein